MTSYADSFAADVVVLEEALEAHASSFPGISKETVENALQLLDLIDIDAKDHVIGVFGAIEIVLSHYLETANFKTTLISMITESIAWISQATVNEEPVARTALLLLMLNKKIIKPDQLALIAGLVNVIEVVIKNVAKIGCSSCC